jgi:hypothetical protein
VRAGGEGLAQVLEARLPSLAEDANAKRDRAGDIGELLGIEWLRRHLPDGWEVCSTLRWKESIRPRRGEDIVAICWQAKPVGLLKGEAKAAGAISSTTVEEARARLNQDHGWPAPFIIDFLVERLEKDNRLDEAQRLFDERFVSQPRVRDGGCTHLLFLLSVDNPRAHIETHAPVPGGYVHQQIAAIVSDLRQSRRLGRA